MTILKYIVKQSWKPFGGCVTENMRFSFKVATCFIFKRDFPWLAFMISLVLSKTHRGYRQPNNISKQGKSGHWSAITPFVLQRFDNLNWGVYIKHVWHHVLANKHVRTHSLHICGGIAEQQMRRLLYDVANKNFAWADILSLYTCGLFYFS